MLTKIILILAYLVNSAFTAPALIPAAAVFQQPLLIQSPQLLRIAPDLAVIDRSLPMPYPFYQSYPYGNVYLLRQQGIGDGSQLADQVQDYFGMFGSQITQLQNQTSGAFQDIQSNVQNSFGQGFELVSQGFQQGFEQVNQGWGDLQQQWGGGSKADNLMSSESNKDELRLEKMENNKLKSQPNLFYQPYSWRYSTNRFIPLGLVRYNLIPLNLQQPLMKPLQEKEKLQSRSSDDKMDKEEPIKAVESS